VHYKVILANDQTLSDRQQITAEHVLLLEIFSTFSHNEDVNVRNHQHSLLFEKEYFILKYLY